MHHIHLKLNERAVIVRDGEAVRALGPGRYTFFRNYDVYRWNLDEVTFHTLPQVLEALPATWFETVKLAERQYAIVLRDERPVKLLQPGVHRMWTLADVRLLVLADTDELPELTPECA